MVSSFKKIFVNRSSQIRSGWKITIMLIVYAAVMLLMTCLAGAVYAIYIILNGIRDINLQDILQNAFSDTCDDFVFAALRALFIGMGTVGSVIAIWKLLDKKPVAELGFTSIKAGASKFLIGLAVGAASISLVFVILLATGNACLDGSLLSPNITLSLLSGLLTFICAGFSEEAFSRGYCMSVLKQIGNTPAIILISAVIFSLLHLGNANVSLAGIINIFLVGVLLSLMFIRTGSLWMPIGFHITWNYFQGSVFGFEVSGLEQSGMYTTKLVSENLINGGAFGPEGGLAVTVVIIAGILAEYFLNKKSEIHNIQKGYGD